MAVVLLVVVTKQTGNDQARAPTVAKTLCSREGGVTTATTATTVTTSACPLAGPAKATIIRCIQTAFLRVSASRPRRTLGRLHFTLLDSAATTTT
ncbi:hypothetical protein PTT_05040 [Pyrenophora teres f. teres 0-1]|uniref:Uncharacterized protein n=1 Tax=Pyrenophora teres f. teres (strain 0-1) TaxID=861557 RepID=E3RET9_PYRTT|nr:hypothetical protein PTT_05040 [Pyrenophora teres f. teres 0-1]